MGVQGLSFRPRGYIGTVSGACRPATPAYTLSAGIEIEMTYRVAVL